MKNPASAKEEREKSSYTVDHGEFKLMRYSLWFIVFAGIIFFLNAFIQPPCGAAVEFKQGEVRRLRLENGMVLLLKENHNLPLAHLYLLIHTGSGREGKFSGSGISHFVEHMLFKGTASRKAGEVFREIESYGGRINAATSYDYTAVEITVPAEVFPLALEIAADMVINATFAQAELEKERKVVLKEISLNQDSPQRYISRLLWQSAYSVHPYKYPILGDEDLLNSLSREDLLEYYRTRYTPDNMILSIVGDVETEESLALVRKIFQDFQRKSIASVMNKPEPPQRQLRKRQEKFTSELTYLLVGFHSVALTDEDCFALDVLAAILGEGESSRLYELICNQKQLAYSVEALNYTPEEPGLFIISFLLEEAHRKDALSLALNQIERLKSEQVDEDELESAKNKIISDLLFHNQTIEAQAQDLALNEALAGDFRFTEKYIQKITAVTAQDLLRVAKRYLGRNNLNTVALIPRDKSPKIRPFKGAGVRLKIGVENLTRPEFSEDLPLIKKYVFDNGLTLLVRENKELPLVSLKAVFQGGLRAEGYDKNGISNLTAEMLDKGTRTRDAAEIAYLAESKGARLSAFSGNNSFGLSLDVLGKDFDELLALFADIIINPTFPQKEFKRQREKKLAQLEAEEDDLFESGLKLLKSTLFRKHPYRFSTIGSEHSLNRLRRRDLTRFYRKFCVGKNMVLAVFGDVDAQEVALKIKELFEGLPAGGAAEITPPSEVGVKGVQTAAKSLPKQQTLLLMGFPGTTVFNQDRYVLELINQILARPSGKLFTQIREKAALAYSLGAYSVLGLDPGYIVIYVATLPEHIATVKQEILEQLTLLQQTLLSEEELAQAKTALLGEELIGRQTNAASALESALDELYGLGYDYYLKYVRQINQVEAADIKRCAGAYFDLDNYAIVIAGSNSRISK